MSTHTTRGFLVSPAKDPGPQPITITNNDAHPHTFSLQPVATQMVGKFCAPTAQAVAWFSGRKTASVPAGTTVSIPVSVAQTPSTPTDVAVKVAPVASAHDHVAVSFVAYAEEIAGGMHGKGCSVVRGVQPKQRSTASAPSSAHSS